MKLLRPLFDLLNKPFPEPESNFGSPRIAAIVSLFVAFFLYVFQPFGIDTLEKNKFLICLGFGAMTFVGATLFELLVGRLLNIRGKPEAWTFGKWILNNLGIMLTISLTNFLFARLVLFGFIDWSLFPVMLYSTFKIGIIPVVVLGGLIILKQEKKYQGMASAFELNENGQSMTSLSQEERLFDIPLSHIIYIQGLQNYVSIGYLNAEGHFAKKTERASLKQILEEVPEGSIIKSHRSFLVNPSAIQSVSGNAQGLLLHLSECDRQIPVSRSYVPLFRKK